MERPSSGPRPLRAIAAAGSLALAAGLLFACEQVQYWTSSDETAPPSAAAASGATTGGATSTGAAGGGTVPATRRDVLEAVAACAVQLYADFRTAAGELDAKAKAAAASPGPESEAAVREAWNAAIDQWQQAELFRFGPAGPPTTPGGKDLREYIYSWPLVSRCLVEQTIVSQSYADASFPTVALVNVRGLAAAEYLLFYTGTDNACAPSASINSSGSWAALGEAELAARKRAYAAVVAADVAARAEQLASAWAPDQGNFAGQLASPGGEGSVYSSERMALNAISDSLFYLDTEVKDGKLGRPLGLVECDEATCPEAIESKYARRSKEHVRNNLLGFRRIALGCDDGEGVGFDDLLATIGAEPVATKLAGGIAGALAAVDAIEEPNLDEALLYDPASVKALHAAIRQITDLLKTDFLTVLDLDLPKVIEGDND